LTLVDNDVPMMKNMRKNLIQSNRGKGKGKV